MLEAIEAILKEELPKDSRYNFDDGTGTAIGKPIAGEIENSLNIEIPYRDSETKFSLPLIWARFDVFIYRGKLVTQQLNPQNGIMARIEPLLADPTCFNTIVTFIKQRCLLTWAGSSTASQKPSEQKDSTSKTTETATCSTSTTTPTQDS